MNIGLPHLGYCLPPTTRTVADLAARGQTTSDAGKLETLGYRTIRVAANETTEELAASAVADLLRRESVDLDTVGLLLYGAGLGTSSFVDPGPEYEAGPSRSPLPLFKFPGCRLQSRLGLSHVPVIGIAQMACNSMHGCLRMARAVLASEPGIEHVLCVAADRFPEGSNREIVYNLMSDGAAAALVSRNARRRRILAMSHITRGAYWDGEASHDRLISAYFPLACQVLNDSLAQAGMRVDDLSLLIPHNINAKSWDILGDMLAIEPCRIFSDNIARVGHVVASDNVINYLDAVDAGRIRPGDRVALFVTGFGAHWSSVIVEE